VTFSIKKNKNKKPKTREENIVLFIYRIFKYKLHSDRDILKITREVAWTIRWKGIEQKRTTYLEWLKDQ